MIDLEYEERNLKKLTYIGVDEVGRGCLAGPVVACAVYIKKNQIGEIKGVFDSKKLSVKKREDIYKKIKQKYLYNVSFVNPAKIDVMNIHKASLLAMKNAVKKINQKSAFILVDGAYIIPEISTAQKSFIKGDERFYSIAAASIIAKVERDLYMRKLSLKYPKYGFDKHKGYGTKQHKAAISEFGILEIHRKSFNLS